MSFEIDWKNKPYETLAKPAENARVWKPVTDIIGKPKSKRLIITVGTSRALDVLRVTAPLMESYARRVNADFRALTDETQSWGMLEKFRVGAFAKHYERTLFIDSDVIISGKAPDIFEEHAPGKVWMRNDRWDLESHVEAQTWPPRQNVESAEIHGYTLTVNDVGDVFNSGVVLTDQRHAPLWYPPEKAMGPGWCDEQALVTLRARALGFQIGELAQVWNHQWWVDKKWSGLAHAHFIHLSGMSMFQPEMIVPMARALTLNA